MDNQDQTQNPLNSLDRKDYSSLVNFTDIQGFIQTVTAAPSAEIPKNIYDQIRFYNGALYIYDTVANTWNTIGGTPYQIGDIRTVLNTSVPSGWIACTGSAISRTTYATLFSLIGTTWGSGDGSTTFNVPDFTGRFLAQYGANGVTTIGTTGGEQTHTLTQSELPTNTVTVDAVTGGGLSGVGNPSFGSGRAGGSAHNNMPPFAGVFFIIKLI